MNAYIVVSHDLTDPSKRYKWDKNRKYWIKCILSNANICTQTRTHILLPPKIYVPKLVPLYYYRHKTRVQMFDFFTDTVHVHTI